MEKRLTALLLCACLALSAGGCVSGGMKTEGNAPGVPGGESEPAAPDLPGEGEEGAGEEAGCASQIITVETFDGLSFEGKLRLPEGGADKLVIYVNGSGPNTYDNHRESGELKFNYFDLFAQRFTAEGAAFFSYNTRGVTPGTEPPYFADIDEEAYQTYIPSNEVKDVVSIIRRLTALPELAEAKVYLLGWSAGTIVAPLAALEGEARVDGLLLAGYCNETMADTLEWQQTGGSAMVLYKAYFDVDGDGRISESEYAGDPYGVSQALGGAAFAELDVTGDGYLDREDLSVLLKDTREAVFKAFDGGDDQWLNENYGVRLTSAWFTDYRRLAPNKETLLKLDLPIHIFQGGLDANTPVEDTYAIEESFRAAGKENLKIHVFGDHDHDLNYLLYPMEGAVSEGLQAIFDTVASL